MKRLSQVLKAYRRRTRLNQHQLAKLLGVSAITVSYWECCRCSPNQVVVKDRMREVLGRNLADMDLR